MSSIRTKTLTLAITASIAALSASTAQAAFFAIREQSAYSQAASFAGASAQDGALSSFFFNPSIITSFEGLNVEGTASLILPSTDIDTTVNPVAAAATAGIGAPIGGFQSTSNPGKNAFVGSNYASYQFNNKIWLGLAVNAPFGLGTRSDPNSLESLSSQEFSALSFNVQPTVAYKFNEKFSVAVGLQAQYIDVEQSTRQLSGVNTELNATDISFGFILGATIRPTDKTTIGIGYRSRMNVDLSGDVRAVTAVARPILSSATADLALPDILNVGVKHKFTKKFSGLAQFSWENWSRLQEVDVIVPGAPVPSAKFEFNLTDSFFYAIGGEYEVNEKLKLRAGVAYETSPTNDNDRTAALPDNNRLWFSAGGTMKFFDHIEADFAATWIRVESDTPVSNRFQSASTLSGAALGPLAGATIASGVANSNVFIFSAGTRMKF